MIKIRLITISQPLPGPSLHVADAGVHLPGQYQDQTFHVIDYYPVPHPNISNVGDPTHEQFLWGIDVLFMCGNRRTILSILHNSFTRHIFPGQVFVSHVHHKIDC